MIYTIVYKPKAKEDIEQVIDYIEQNLYSPITAKRFAQGLYTKIDTLKVNAGIFAISTYQDVLQYGLNARTVVFKGFAVIYTIHGHHVLVHRIIHGSLIQK